MYLNIVVIYLATIFERRGKSQPMLILRFETHLFNPHIARAVIRGFVSTEHQQLGYR